MEIETDKTTVSVPCPCHGIIEEIYVQDGDTVKAGQQLFKVKKTDGPPAAAAKPAAASAPPPPKPAAAAPPPPPTPKPAAAAPPPPPPPAAARPPPPPPAGHPPPPPPKPSAPSAQIPVAAIRHAQGIEASVKVRNQNFACLGRNEIVKI